MSNWFKRGVQDYADVFSGGHYARGRKRAAQGRQTAADYTATHSIDPNTGDSISGADLRTTSALVDTYTIVVYGMDAFGSVGLGKKHTDGVYRAGDNTGGWEMIHKERGSGGTSDPFNEIATLAWKAFFAGAVLNANWSRAIRVGATNLAN